MVLGQLNSECLSPRYTQERLQNAREMSTNFKHWPKQVCMDPLGPMFAQNGSMGSGKPLRCLRAPNPQKQNRFQVWGASG